MISPYGMCWEQQQQQQPIDWKLDFLDRRALRIFQHISTEKVSEMMTA